MNIRFPVIIDGKRISNRAELLKLGESDPAVQNFLGEAFYYGNGFPKDIKKSRMYITLASENGNSDAMTSLGYMCEKGIGSKADIEESIKWYKKAYEMGDKSSYAPMIDIYLYGKGSIEQNMQEAFRIVKEGIEKQIDSESFSLLLDGLKNIFGLIYQTKCDIEDIYEYSKQIADGKYDIQCLVILVKIFSKFAEEWRRDYEQL